MTSSALPAPVTAEGRATVDLRDRASSMSLVMNLGNEPQMIQALGSSEMRMEMVLDGNAVYAKLPPAVTARLPMPGKQWIKIDLGKLGGLPGLSALSSNPTATDPSRILRWLKPVSDSVVAAGQQRVSGIVTTHYQAQLSLDRLADGLSATDRALAKKALSLFETVAQSHSFPVDGWVDAHQLVRRISITISLGLPNGPSMQETETVDLSHYGPQPRPVLPPVDQVYSAS